MLVFLHPSLQNPGRTASLSGCRYVVPALTGSSSAVVADECNVIVGFRWRAGNLTSRNNSKQWTRSVSSPIDQKRPNPVQGQALPVDGSGVALPLIDQIHDVGSEESAF